MVNKTGGPAIGHRRSHVCCFVLRTGDLADAGGGQAHLVRLSCLDL